MDSFSTQAPLRPTLAPIPIVDLDALRNASYVLDEQTTKDALIVPDLGELMTTQGAWISSSYSHYPNDYRVPFQKRRLLRLPEAIWEFYNTAHNVSYMGLMPEIERVWISIDHKLFLWDYVEGMELSSFVEQKEVITHVTLVKPKPGVFVENVSRLLVLCTAVSVVIIGVACNTAPMSANVSRQVVRLYATDLTIRTEVTMDSVVGMDDGRIFMCGSQDGNLYELHYQEKESWFGKKIELINHSAGGVQSLFPRFKPHILEDRHLLLVADNARQCIYALTSKNTISIYRPTSDKSVEHVQTLSNLVKMVMERVHQAPGVTPRNLVIVGLHVVPPHHTKIGIHLVAVTVTGIRLYFCPTSAYNNYGAANTSRSGSMRLLQLVHIRLPPLHLPHPDDEQHVLQLEPATFENAVPVPVPQPRPYTVSAIDSTYHFEGLTLCAQPGDSDGSDFVFCTSPDLPRIGSFGQPGSFPPQIRPPHQGPVQQPEWSAPSAYIAPSPRPPLTEHATLLSIAGRTFGIATLPRAKTYCSAAATLSTPAPPIVNELATQFSQPARHIMILTNSGLSFLAKRRAVDYLRAVLEEYHAEGKTQPMDEFRNSYGRDQSCAMLLGFASGNTFLDNDVPLGFDPGIVTSSTVNPELALLAKKLFYDVGERPIWAERAYGVSVSLPSHPMYSGRREGLALYLARLVRPFWKAKITKTGPTGLQETNVSDSILVVVQKNLHSLKDFLDKNPQLFHSSPGDLVASSNSDPVDKEAWKAEQNSVTQLLTLLGRTIEAVSFFLLLNDYKLGELVARCEQDIQNAVKSLTFEELITSARGQDVSRGLVKVVIDQQIGQQISIDTISDVLRQRCGTFCSTDDVMLYKAKENLQKAAEVRNNVEQQRLLAESLRLFTKGARMLELEKLREVVGDYQYLNFVPGAVELPIFCARILDPDNIGIEFWKDGLPPHDQRAAYYEGRLRCYDLALHSISVFEQKSNEARVPYEPLIPGHDGPDTLRLFAYQLALASEDELFHSSFYNWLIGKGLAEELLDMRSPYLEDYLKRGPVTLQKCQLLWQFYVKNDQPLKAAEVLGALAEATQLEIPLETRIEYLTLAVGNAKSHPMSVSARQGTAVSFLTDLEEKLDVAQIQLELHNVLVPTVLNGRETDPQTKEKIRSLNERLHSISDLYLDFAEPFDLPAVKLLIFHVAEHRDENLARQVWNQIFDEVLDSDSDPRKMADILMSKVVPLGQRFYPSESAFPLRHVATLLVRFALANKGRVPIGWTPRLLVQCGVPYVEIWDVLHEMYESQIPPFNDQANIQTVSSDIAILLDDWVTEYLRTESTAQQDELPARRLELAIELYLTELDVATMPETKTIYEGVKRRVKRLISAAAAS